MISQKTLINLEYDKLLECVSTRLSSSLARENLKNSIPFVDYDLAIKFLNKTAEADRILYDFLINPYFAFDDISDTLISAKRYSVLSPIELLRIGKVLKTSRKVVQSINSVPCEDLYLLKEDASFLYENATLETHILEWIISETEIADFASDKLFSLRKQIRKTNENVKKKMQEYVQSNKYQKYLQDTIITVRGDRYVIPVKAEYKTAIGGLIHDQSASGATVFLEPFPIVELNNELKTLLIEEKNEIERILADLSEEVGGIADKLDQNCQILADLDVVFAKAIYAHETKAVMPILNENKRIDIKNGRHPLIDKDKVVPVSVKVGENYSILLVSGPNTGGKTVTLKLTGLLTLMAMSGMFIPADEQSEIGFFSSIFTDIGDEQSIEQSLSTFSAHIKNIAHIVDNLTPDCLVLLDELGAGTDPVEGSAIAVSVTEEILSSGAKAVITSHFSEMKAFSFSTSGIENASMEFNPRNFAPTYKLNIGIPGASNALKIAQRLGFSQKIIDRAISYIAEDKISFESVLLDAESVRIKSQEALIDVERMRKEVQDEKNEVLRLKRDLEEQKRKLTENAEKKAKKIIDDYVEEAEEIIEKMKSAKNLGGDKGFFEATKLNKSIHDLKYKNVEEKTERVFDNSEIKVGDKVFLEKQGFDAEVVSIKPNGKCTLRVGGMEINSTLNELKKVKTKPVKEEKIKHISVIKPLNTEAVKTEINVIGQDREECLYNVSYFIDKCVVSGVEIAKIIHGTGSGVLKKAVADFLKKHSHVKSFRAGRFGEGDNGVTIVELK